MESRCRAPFPLSLAALLLLIWAPGLGAQTKIKCHHEDNVDTSEKIFKVFNQSVLGLHQCDAPLKNSACHIVSNLRGRVRLNFGCGNCSTVVVDKEKRKCDDCNSTNCNFDHNNATTFPEFIKWWVVDKSRECLAFHGDEPSDLKSASAVRIKCIDNSLEKLCARSFYLDSKIKKTFIGCYFDCIEAIKGKKMSDRTGRDARCSECLLEGEASTALVKDACLGLRPEIYKGPDTNRTGRVIHPSDKPQDRSRAPLGPAPAGGPLSLLTSATVVLLALHLATGH